MECLLPHLCMVTVPHIMVGLERLLDYRGVGLARFHCIRHRQAFTKLHISDHNIFIETGQHCNL